MLGRWHRGRCGLRARPTFELWWLDDGLGARGQFGIDGEGTLVVGGEGCLFSQVKVSKGVEIGRHLVVTPFSRERGCIEPLPKSESPRSAWIREIWVFWPIAAPPRDQSGQLLNRTRINYSPFALFNAESR